MTIVHKDTPKASANLRSVRRDGSHTSGIVRKADEPGRIVLPIELCRTLDISEKDSPEIYVDRATIILKKYQPDCIFCDDAKEVIHFRSKNVFPKCLVALKGI